MDKNKLETLIKGFRPKFGDQASIDITERIGKVRKLQERVKNHNARVRQLETAISKKTESEKNLETMENALARDLEKHAQP